MKKIKVMGIFTSYNREEITKQCIESLLKDINILWEFVVCDDLSADGTYNMLKTYNEVNLIKGDGSCFYSGGMRVAIDKAKKISSIKEYDYILLLNDDVKFFGDSIYKLIQYLNRENAIIVGATQNSKGKLSYGGIKSISKFGPKYESVMSNKDKIECDTFNANCVLIPKSIFMELDNIDSMYRHSLGDFDYGLNAKRHGYKIYVSNFFVGICNNNPIVGSWNDKDLNLFEKIKKKESIKGQPLKIWFYYIRKNYNFFSACIYCINDYIKIIFKI